jgi:hypothetical protein
MHASRFALIASSVAAAEMLAACGSTVPLYGPGSTSAYPATAPATAPATLEYGRVTNMEILGTPNTQTTSPVYRVSIQTDQGAMRVYDVPTTGNLRVGDRVRVENGVIYRS